MSKEEIKNRKEDVNRKILDASWDIAVEEGIEALSIRKVAAVLHFAPNNIYNYFKSKSDLIYQLKKDAYEWTLEVVFKDIPKFETACGLFDYTIHKLMYIALREPERYVVMTSDSIIDREEPLDQKINDYVADILRRGIDTEEIRPLDTQMTAMNIRIAIIGFMRWISLQKKMTKEQAESYLDNFISVLLNGLKTEECKKEKK